MSADFLLTNAKVVAPSGIIEGGCVAVKGGRIYEVCAVKPEACRLPEYDCKGGYLLPGFIEIHSHGGGGFDVMDGTADDIVGAARMHYSHGTTTYLPTSLTCPDDELFAFFEHFEDAQKVTDGMPHLAGLHLEGPYFSPAQAGAQPPEYIITPNKAHYEEILRKGKDHILRWSVAPELEGAFELGDVLKERGILVSIGHSDADYDCIKESLKHGFSHVTHLYSGMSSIVRRRGFRVLGVVECAYLFDELTVETITDGKHLPPELLRLVFKCKNHDSITLVTDSMRGAGMPDGPSIVGSRAHGTPAIIKDGIASLPDFSAFAGSVATSDHLLRTAVSLAGLDIVTASRMLSLNPARLINLDKDRGSIEAGKRADLVLMDSNLNVAKVWVDGN